MGRLVIERLSEGTASASPDAPALEAIRLVFGVGKGPDTAPDASTFAPVYRLSIPVFSLGGLDPDGVYEFDAKALLTQLQSRSTRRKWAVRLELDLAQKADATAAGDIWVDTPYADGGDLSADVLGNKRGSTTAGGGRSVTVASTLVNNPDAVAQLGGTFTVRVADGDPDESPNVCSKPREIKLAFTNYEFEG